MDKHDLICQLKDLALELGRVPTKREYTDKYRHSWETPFGTFAAFKQAAGLDSDSYSERKIDNSIFEKDINTQLNQYVPRKLEKREYPTALIISDIHFPWANEFVLEKFYERVSEVQPQFIIGNGDFHDMYSHSRFPRSHNIFTPREERAKCLEMNKDFWTKVKKYAPNANCFQLAGNHSVRPLKQILEVYPAGEDWIREALERDFTFDGVKTILDIRQELHLADDIIVFHGYRTQVGAHRDYTHMNCIVGHTHKASVSYRRIMQKTLWELNSGFAGDPEGKGLTYTPQKIMDYTPGFAELDRHGPRVHTF